MFQYIINMFRYVVVLLLLNTAYCSFGKPIKVSEIPGSLGKSLQLLAESCQNKFLAIQIKDQLQACNITLSVEGEIKETELECLIFYDINRQLCTALRESKLDPNETYHSAINQDLKVDKTCGEASKYWKFSNLTEYPMYYNTSQTVFKTSVKCLQACGVEDLLSEDTNFFCKYYQWGTELLRLQLMDIPLTGDVLSGESGAGSMLTKNATTVPQSPVSLNSQQPQSINEHIQLNNVLVPGLEQAQDQLPPPKSPPKDVDNSKHVLLPANGTQLKNEHLNDAKSAINEESQHPAPQTSSSAKNHIEQSLISNDLSTMKSVAKDLMRTGNEHPNSELGDDNDNDAGEYEYDLHDSPANEGNNVNLETEHDLKEDKKTVNVPVSQNDLYTMSDQFGEVDDHFFSFFLTATILVIFFYVLYHNKSKFRKVFLGLLVEGRQPGRRRNSRGHEYRRLDTLEQAMSTNSTAPPSKIIY